MSREPDLGALRLLTHIAKSGSISAASAAAGVSQQAASLRIRSLEEDLGLPLLVRSARGSRPTEAGELVVGWARPLLAAADDYAGSVSALATDRDHTLRIAASLTVAEHLLPEWLARWRIAAGETGAAAQLTAANSAAVVDAVREGDVDLGFVETPTAPDALATATVGADDIVVVVAANHRWAGRVVTPEEVASTAFVLREPGSGTRLTFEHALAAAGTPLSQAPAAVHETTLGVRSAVISGIAPGALSALAVAEDLRSGRLVRVPVQGLEMARPVTAVWRGPAPAAEAAAFLRVGVQAARRVRPNGRRR